MTIATFYSEGPRLIGFAVQGHSGFAPEGEDLVCAAITSSLRLVETTINDVLGLGAAVKVLEDTISLKLPGSLGSTNESTCQSLLAGFLLHLVQLSEEYPENITVMEV
ncbi:MAG: ribosomal-processing cysteine protease Prp [Eubacteriales bacterium]